MSQYNVGNGVLFSMIVASLRVFLASCTRRGYDLIAIGLPIPSLDVSIVESMSMLLSSIGL